MKKFYRQYVSILMAALCLAFTSCNQGIDAERGFGEVRVVIGGGAARAVDKGTGLPIFDDTNTKITVTDKDGNKLAEGTTSVTFQAAIGKKITVKAVVTAAAGQWRGSAEHTVTEGTNIVALKLSKAPKSMGNILIEVNGTGDSCTLKMASGKVLVSNAWINTHHGTYPITARDKIGRVYVLYKDTSHGLQAYLKRFDAEGTEDAGFEAAIMPKLPATTSINTMTVDAKTNTIFIVGTASDGTQHTYAVTEKEHNNFTLSNGFNLTSIGIGNTIQAAAAYNGTLFFTVPPPSTHSASGMKNKLVAVKAELSDSSLTLSNKIEMELPKLRTTAGAFNSYLTNCTGLFADESGVYCLLSEQNLQNFDRKPLYALGQIIRYQYSGSAFTDETKIGLNSKAAGTDGIPFDARYFSNPVGFIGYDEENIYIADDGFNIEYLNENWRTNGNKNRIAAFNRNTKEITFTDTEATWYGQKPEYKYPDTKILLWKKNSNNGYGFDYYQVASAEDSLPAQAFGVGGGYSVQGDHHLTDVFCYDQDGNLYIVRKRTGSYCICRFELQDDGSYNQEPVIMTNNLSSNPTAIAVDISDGKNYLYYYDSGTNKIERFKWEASFSSDSKDTTYSIALSGATPTEIVTVTALAANKDGVFVGIKTVNVSASSYGLSVKKYSKENGTHTNPVGTITVGESQTMPTEPTTSPYTPYTKIESTINDLRIVDGMLYAVTSKLEKRMAYRTADYGTDEFKSSGLLYKIAEAASFSGNAMVLHTKYPVLPQGTSKQGVGYGFYRFIAVQPKKLVIASGGACARGGNALAPSGTQPDRASDNKVMTYDLDGNLQEPEEKNAGGTFSQKLSVDSSGFNWE